MLPADELARLQADLLYTLPDLCAIYTATRAGDGFGGVTTTWAAAASDVACRLDQKQGREQNAGGQWQWFSRNVLTLPASTTITAGQRVIKGGVTYNVVSVSEGSLPGVKRAMVERA